jgi:ATP-binding cassette subfamily C protein LapB
MLNTLNTPLFITILDTPFAIIYIFAIFFISVSIGWIVLSLIILTLVVTYLLSIKIGENTKKSLDANIEKNSYALSIEHTELIKANGAKNLIEENYKKGFNSALDLKNLIQQEQSKLQNMNLTMSMLLSALVIAFGAKEVVDGNIDFGMLIGINILSAKAIMILTKPVSSISNIIKHKDTKEFIDKFMSMKQDKKDGLIIKNFDSNMEIKDISFGYGNGPIIRNLTVEIKKGSLVKIIGSNGRGKTTLCRLLCGMFEPKVGNILVDGIDLRQIDTNWWSSKVSYIPQEPEFINSTIKENILMMNSEIDDSRISNIIKDADLENFINLSTDGLNMKISNSARDLPVGIRRRLSLARAIANDGDIVIIDEPTDGLDQQGVKAIANYVNSSLSNKKTVIVATHSLNLINNEKIIIDLNSKIAKVKYNV